MLFDRTNRSSTALVWAPFSHAKDLILGVIPADLRAGTASAAAGVQGYIASLPRGFSCASSLSGSPLGLTDAMHACTDLGTD